MNFYSNMDKYSQQFVDYLNFVKPPDRIFRTQLYTQYQDQLIENSDILDFSNEIKRIKSKYKNYRLIDRLITIMKFAWMKSSLLILIMQSTLINACIYSQFFTIYNGSTTATQRSASGRTFQVLWSSSQVGIISISFIFMGFSLLNQNKAISFQANINSFNSTSTTFFYNPRTNSQIVYAHFSIIALKSCPAEIYLYYHQHTATTLSNSNRGSSSQYFNFPVGFTFNKTSYLVIPIISSFYLNSYKDLLDLKIATQAFGAGASTIPMVLSSGSVYENSLQKIAFTLILAQTSSLIASQMIYHSSLQFVPPSSITVSTQFTESNCAFGISYLQTDKFQDNPMSVNLVSSGLVNSPIIYNYTKSLILIGKFSILCLISCPTNSFLNGSSCLPCTSFLTGCVDCSSKYNCLNCSPSYFINIAANETCTPCLAPCSTCTANTTCLTCLSGFYLYQPTLTCINCLPECIACNSSTTCTICSNGTAVQGGCTTDSVCVTVNSSLSFSSLRCIACDPPNIYTPLAGKCVCANGYTNVSGICVNTTGCLTATLIDNDSLCTSCNTSLNFMYSAINGTCVCNVGSYLNSTICMSCLPECLACQNGVTCFSCILGYLVEGGCSSNPYCTQVNSSLNFSSNRCLACRLDLNLIAIGGICTCQAGYKDVSGLCSKDPGCISAQLINTTTYCSTCNYSSGFLFSPINGVCKCPLGFQLQFQTCIQICGDGLIQDNACDDGNTINGDGCSSQCIKQSKFQCYGSPSICKYLRYDISLVLIKVEKIFMQNKGIFSFKIIPHISSFVPNYLLENFYFLSNRTFSITSKYFADDIFTIQVEYSQNLQGYEAKIELSLDPVIFAQTSVQLEFKMISSNSKLVILENQERVKIFIKIIGWFSLAIIFLSLLGFIFHKMLGLELLHSLQVIYIVHLINEYYTAPFSIISYLDTVSFNFLFSTNYASNIRVAHHNFPFKEDNQFITELFTAGFSLIIMIIVLLGKIFEKCTEEQSQRNGRREKMNSVFNKICFPISIGGLFIFFLLKITHNDKLQGDLLIKISFFISTIIISFIIFYEIKVIFGCKKLRWQQCSRSKSKWVSAYLIFYLVVLLLISIKYTFNLFPLEQILPCIYMAFFILVIVQRPYKDQVHNTGIIIHTFTTLYFSFWVVMRKHFESLRQEENQLLGLFILIVLIGVSLGIGLSRVIFEIRYCFRREKHSKSINQEVKKDTKPSNHQIEESRSRMPNKDSRGFLFYQSLYLNHMTTQQFLNIIGPVPVSFFSKQSKKNPQKEKIKDELKAYLLMAIQNQAAQELI